MITTTILFQNCSVRRMEGFELSSTGAGGGGSGGGGAGGGGGSGGGGESCKPAPANLDFASFVPKAVFKSQEINVNRLSSQFLNSTSITLLASSECIAQDRSCNPPTDGGGHGTCQSKAFSMMSISFKCSGDADSDDCDLITPGETVNLAGAMSSAVKDLSLSYM